MSKLKDGAVSRSERFISRKELARRWGVSTRTIDFRRKDGSLPNPIVLDQKGGRSLRFRLSEIEAYEESLRQRGVNEHAASSSNPSSNKATATTTASSQTR